MMKLNFGLNLNSILLAIVFSVVVLVFWLVFKLYRVIEGATTQELSKAKSVFDSENSKLSRLNTELASIESAHSMAINKYTTDIANAINKVTSQARIVDSLQPKFNAQARIVNMVGISPNLYDMNITLQSSKTLLETYKTNRENIKKAHAKAIRAYKRVKNSKNKQITEQTRVVRNTQKAYNKLLPPIINSITPGDGKVTLSISPVAGTNPTGYIINSGDAENFVKDVNKPYVFDGLTNGKSYTFYVASDYGSSTSTEAQSGRIEPKSTIEIAKVTPGNGQATIEIKYNDNVVPFSYTVVSIPSTTTVLTTNVNSPIVFTKLKNRISYKFALVATYRDGKKSKIITSQSVTPLSPISASISGIQKNKVTVSITNNNAGDNHPEVLYTITTSPDDITKTSRSKSNDINGLKPNTQYAFNVKATYSDGSVQNTSVRATTRSK